MMKEVYLDNAATTPTDPKVVEVIADNLTNNWGNASSLHGVGRKARASLENSRSIIAKSINADDEEIIFTSGGTESNNTAILKVADRYQKFGKHIITTKIEHPSVLRPMEKLEKDGFTVTYLDVNEDGVIDLDQFKQALDDETILVSIMTGNNEVGSHMPIHEIGEILKDHQAIFHTDAVQAYGLLDIDVKRDHIDLLSTSAHKLNGPKMLGFLYKNSDVNFDSFVLGGEQEDKRRAGTENVANIAGFASAVERLTTESKTELQEKYVGFKHQIIDFLNDNQIDFDINGSMSDDNLQHVFNIWLKGHSTYVMQTNLDLAGIAISGGSACTAGSLEPSHVLIAMYGEDSPRISESIRISFGKYTTSDDISYLCNQLKEIVDRLNSQEA
ncbi:cysteine desulfurase [Pediococcus argentinicus]|uniref:Cysteine desulfurase n=2 Tax=Pediococcus argentinicus TaxID=480391 RepID=A0A0R2NIF5_9LACO|nr:cysteine desulfurase [Pediococcus argentinicus]